MILEFGFHATFIALQIRKRVWTQKFVEELRQKDSGIFIAFLREESFLVLSITKKAEVAHQDDQRLVVHLFHEVLFKEVQDVPDLPEPTLFLSLQVELGDDITD